MNPPGHNFKIGIRKVKGNGELLIADCNCGFRTTGLDYISLNERINVHYDEVVRRRAAS